MQSAVLLSRLSVGASSPPWDTGGRGPWSVVRGQSSQRSLWEVEASAEPNGPLCHTGEPSASAFGCRRLRLSSWVLLVRKQSPERF